MSHISERPGDGPTADFTSFKTKIGTILQDQFKREFKTLDPEELIKPHRQNRLDTQKPSNPISIQQNFIEKRPQTEMGYSKKKGKSPLV